MSKLLILKAAQEAQKLSTDLRRPIGVIIESEGQIIGRGYNKATLKLKWFNQWHKNHCLRKIFNVPKNGWYWFCPGCALSHNHAEMVAIRNMTTKLEQNNNSTLYILGHSYCCDNCLKHIKKANIKNIKVL